MTNLNEVNKIKKRLFGDLEVKVIENIKEPDKIIFKHKIEFGKSALYCEYDLKNKQISVYNYSKGRSKGRKKIYGGLLINSN